jgi:hypothetical protein
MERSAVPHPDNKTVNAFSAQFITELWKENPLDTSGSANI